MDQIPRTQEARFQDSVGGRRLLGENKSLLEEGYTFLRNVKDDYLGEYKRKGDRKGKFAVAYRTYDSSGREMPGYSALFFKARKLS